jgi:WYL_2, Sm-like SH3 beta-barrel fold
MTITHIQAAERILKYRADEEGKIFSCKFVKKDGSIREMVSRFNVQKGVNGNGMSYDPIARGMVPVFDMQKNEWRMINFSTIFELKIEGEVYKVEG